MGKHEIAEPRVKFSHARVVRGNVRRHTFHFGKYSRGVFAGAFAARNFVAGFVAFGFQALDGGDGLASFLIERAESGNVKHCAAIARHLLE